MADLCSLTTYIEEVEYGAGVHDTRHAAALDLVDHQSAE